MHSPERVLRPLRRAGAKGEGRFAPIGWDEALDEIVARWQRILAEDGPLALLGYAYSAHQGQLNRGLVLGLFHALGATRLQAGTVCDTCAEAGWDAACGSVGGSDPESVVESDLVISWGADLLTTNLHIWPLVERARAKGAPLVVIEPRRSDTATRADWHLRVNVGTDAALALGVMHVLARDGLCDRAYLARHTVGFEKLEAEVLPRFAPARVAEITGVSVADLERLARMYGRARAPFIRLGEGMSRCTNGGQAVRAVSLLPGVVGAYAKRGGGALLMTATGFGFDSSAIRKPSGPSATRLVNHSRLGEALLTMKDPPIRALFVAANNPAVTCPDVAAVRRGLAREDLFTVVHDPFLSDTARYADIVLPAATHYESEDVVRAYGTYWMQFIPQVVPPQGEAWPNRRLAQELARRMGVKDPVFSMDTDELIRAFFQNAKGPAAAVDPAALRRRAPSRWRIRSRWAGPAVRHAVRQARVLLRDAGRAGPARHARLGGRARRRRRALSAAPPHRAGVLPGTHRLCRRGRAPEEGGPAGMRPPSRGCRGARTPRRRTGGALQRARRGNLRAAGERRDAAGRGVRARAAAGGRGPCGHDQHALLHRLQRHGRGRDLPEHPPRRAPPRAPLISRPARAKAVAASSRCLHRPLKTGRRFSPNAFTPSW